MKAYGKPANDFRLIVKSAMMGRVEFELIQPVSGESVLMEFLEKKGEGINHLAFLVDDIEKERVNLQKKGFNVVLEAKFVGGGGFAYFDTNRVGNIHFELIQWPPGLSGF